jgi:hypothetical protein
VLRPLVVTKGSKIVSRTASEIPGPVSAISRHTVGRARSRRATSLALATGLVGAEPQPLTA